MIKVGKYSFPSEEMAKQRISEVDGQGHSIVELGFLLKIQGVYDEEGNTIVEPILSEKYSVDVMWLDLESHPEGWQDFCVDLQHDGAHMFAGYNYKKHKL